MYWNCSVLEPRLRYVPRTFFVSKTDGDSVRLITGPPRVEFYVGDPTHTTISLFSVCRDFRFQRISPCTLKYKKELKNKSNKKPVKMSLHVDTSGL
jgi:hypothetical protein